MSAVVASGAVAMIRVSPVSAGDLNLLSGLKALSFSILADGLDFLLESEMNPEILASAARL